MSTEHRTKVTLIIVARNEIGSIDKALTCLLRQTYPKELTEIILVDSMSTDGTRKFLDEKVRECRRDGHDLKLLDNPDRILAAGWNKAIKSATGDIVCRIDAHSEISSDYVEIGVRELIARRESHCAGIGGVAENVGENLVGSIVADLYSSRFGVGNATHRIGCSDIQETDTAFFAVYWKKLFDEEGFFDERLARNQDIDFHIRIRKKGWRLLTHPAMGIKHHVRQTLLAFLRKAFLDGYWVIYSRQAYMRHKIPLLFLIYLVLSIPASCLLNVAYLLPLAFYAVMSLVFAFKDGTSISSKIMMPPFFAMLHLSYGLGSLKGTLDLLWQRARSLCGLDD